MVRIEYFFIFIILEIVKKYIKRYDNSENLFNVRNNFFDINNDSLIYIYEES
jgi:hypothetical protein